MGNHASGGSHSNIEANGDFTQVEGTLIILMCSSTYFDPFGIFGGGVYIPTSSIIHFFTKLWNIFLYMIQYDNSSQFFHGGTR